MGFDLGEVFRMDVSPLELFVRTTIVYLGLLVAMRVLARRLRPLPRLDDDLAASAVVALPTRLALG